MNSSEPPSSPEEKWTAYLDGKLSPSEEAVFERENPGASAERESHSRLAGILRRHSAAPVLRNPDFLNDCILREITPPRPPTPARARAMWPLWRMALAGACCMAAVLGIYGFFVRGNGDRSGLAAQPAAANQEAPEGDYYAEVISASAGDTKLDATVLDAEGIAVVWLDGVEELPADYVLK